jgi:hypothetical protein
METPPQNNKPSINFTLIIIVVIFCTSALFGLYLLRGNSNQKTVGFNVLRQELPLYISWRETKMPGHTQVAMIWPKAEAPLPLRVVVEIEDSSTGKLYGKEIIIESYHTAKEPLEIGWLEGHQFVPGDKITLRNKNYSSIESMCANKK